MKLNGQKDSYENVEPYHCSMCNELEEAHYFDNKRMVDKKLCFNCNFWDELTNIKSTSIRINGEHYMLGSKKTPDKWNGFGGREFTIKMNDGSIVKTFDLWYQGAIPERFKNKLPDNAEFVKLPDPVGHGQGFLGKW